MAFAVPFAWSLWCIFSTRVFDTEMYHQNDTECLSAWYYLGRFWNVSPKRKKPKNAKNFVFLNCSVVNQRQLGNAMPDSLTESITKVIHTWLRAECYLVYNKNVSPRKECLKNKWKISNEDCHRVRLGQSMLDNTFPKRKLVKKETEMPFRKQQKTRIRSRVRLG